MTAPRVHAPASLATLLQGARRRWRLRHLSVGLAITVAAVLLVLAAGSFALEAARFSTAAITAARVVVGIVAALVVGRWLAWPLLRRLPDDRLALYLEERVPQLGGAVLTAVTLRRQADTGHSAMLERGLVADATRRLGTTPAVPRLERPTTLRALSVSAAVTVAAGLAFQFGPAFLRTGALRLLAPWQDAAAAPVYAIALEPQSIVVARGSDVQLGATLAGFESEVVDLVVRRGTSAEWERIPMGAGASRGAFVVRLFDVAEDAEFYAEANGVRSLNGKLTVKDLPGVQRIGVELRYPSYMNLPPDVTEDGGDIAAPGGTTALLRVHTTRPVSGGKLFFDGSTIVPMERLDDSTVIARLTVRKDGFYRVELTSTDGTVVRGTVEYAVDALDDAGPSVRIRQPGRDLRPTSVDEVLIEAEATDDYGIGKLEIVYRVNGGEEKAIALTEGTGVRPREVIASHTLFLEEMDLSAGDVVSYYARALDNDQRPQPKSGASDIQFLTIRPFSREYKQNQQGGGGEDGGPQEMNPGSLVQRQRDIVAGTFKTERDRAKTPAATLRGDVSTLHLAQGRLREELTSLQKRVERPAAQAADTSFRILAEVLPKAGIEMKAAEELLVQGKTGEALAPEQRALQWLEKAEAAFREVQVSMQQQGGGGGGGGGANASDLADLLELETDKMRNQYDQVQRSREERGAQKTDETLERLKQLAARQQQELARQRSQQQGGGTGGGSQRQLAEETEAAARQLERLAREQQSPEMESTAQEMRKAAESMRRSAASGGAAAAQAAAERLESAKRALETAREQSAGAGLGDATTRARALAEEQRGVQGDVEKLAKAGGADRAERQRRLDERKAGMEAGVKALASDLDRLARENRQTNPRAAREAQEAAAAMREARLGDKIRYSRDVLRSGSSSDYAKNLERSIQQDLDSLEQRVAGAAGAAVAGRDSSQRTSRALAQARDLVRGLSSLDDRLREREQRGAAGRAGPAGAGAGSQGSGQGQSGAGQSGAGAQGKGNGQGQGQGQGNGQGQGQGQPGPDGGTSRTGGLGGAAGQGRPGGAGGGETFTVEEARQLSRELRTRRNAAQQLRRELQGKGVDTKDLDRAIARLGALDGEKVLGNAEAMKQLRDGVVEDLKSFEFALRRKLGAAEAGGPALGGSEQVPAQYREMVNEYFKSLARKP